MAEVDDDTIDDPVAANRLVAETGIGVIGFADEDVIEDAVAEDRAGANVGDGDLGELSDADPSEASAAALLAFLFGIYTQTQRLNCEERPCRLIRYI